MRIELSILVRRLSKVVVPYPLQESVVTFVAVVFGHSAAQKEIGIGAALGGLLVLATVAYSVVGLVFLTTKHGGDRRVLSRPASGRLVNDQKWFMVVFVFKVGLELVAFAIEPWLGALFLLAYAAYVRQELTTAGGHGDAEDIEPLKSAPTTKCLRSHWRFSRRLPH